MKNSLPKLLLTGSEGQVGTAIRNHALATQFELISCSRNELDITDAHNTKILLKKYSPAIVINTAAYTAVDKAEIESELAMRVNHIGARNIAKSCSDLNIPLIHLSTDYIFSGETTTPYTEKDAANPLSVYGQSKWLGEQAIRSICKHYLILRVSGIFSEYGNNFYKTILRLAQEKETLRIVNDQITCPTYAADIAQTALILSSRAASSAGPSASNKTYHYCSVNPVSWHTFATAILNNIQQKKTREILPITTTEYNAPAQRPAYSALDCSKLYQDYGIAQPHWENALKELA